MPGIDAGDARAEARERLRDEPAAAADIEHAQAIETLGRFRVASELARRAGREYK